MKNIDLTQNYKLKSFLNLLSKDINKDIIQIHAFIPKMKSKRNIHWLIMDDYTFIGFLKKVYEDDYEEFGELDLLLIHHDNTFTHLKDFNMHVMTYIMNNQ